MRIIFQPTDSLHNNHYSDICILKKFEIFNRESVYLLFNILTTVFFQQVFEIKAFAGKINIMLTDCILIGSYFFKKQLSEQ